MKHDDGDPVYPTTLEEWAAGHSGETQWRKYYGLAMQGLLCAPGWLANVDQRTANVGGDFASMACSHIAKRAADIADAMIAEMREREKRA